MTSLPYAATAATMTTIPIAGIPTMARKARDDRVATGHLSCPAYAPPGAVGSDLCHTSSTRGYSARIRPLRPPLALAPATHQAVGWEPPMQDATAATLPAEPTVVPPP